MTTPSSSNTLLSEQQIAAYREIWLLGLGGSSSSVTALQRKLCSYMAVTVDGVWGPQTANARNLILDRLWMEICVSYGWEYKHLSRGRFRAPSTIVEFPEHMTLHWPAGEFTADSFYKYISESTGSISSHFAVDEKKVICMVAPHYTAWHAYLFNDRNIGIDICTSESIRDRAKLEKRGIWAGEVEWAGSTWADLDAKVAVKTLVLCKTLCYIFELPYTLRWNIHEEGTIGDHRALDESLVAGAPRPRKIDIRPWKPVIEKAHDNLLHNRIQA